MLLAAGCAGTDGGFPSLQPRAIEKIDIAGEPMPVAATAVAPDPVVARAAAAALADAEAGDGGFLDAMRAAEPALRAAARAAPGSDGWIAGQQALSRVQAALLPTADALQTLDAQRLATGAGPPDPALEQAWSRAAALDAAHRAAFSRLAALLPPG